MTLTITIYKVCVIINVTWFEGKKKYWLSCLIVIGVDFPFRFPFAEALPDVKRKIQKKNILIARLLSIKIIHNSSRNRRSL